MEKKAEKELPVHFCRSDRELRAWCGLSLAGDRYKRWNYGVEGVTCKRCLRAIDKYKTLDKLPDMSSGVPLKPLFPVMTYTCVACDRTDSVPPCILITHLEPTACPYIHEYKSDWKIG